jgi:hypothetical protein
MLKNEEAAAAAGIGVLNRNRMLRTESASVKRA